MTPAWSASIYLPRVAAEPHSADKQPNRTLGRRVYTGVENDSVYAAAWARRKGIGFAFLSLLIRASKLEDIWTLQAGIYPENTGNIELVKKAGF